MTDLHASAPAPRLPHAIWAWLDSSGPESSDEGPVQRKGALSRSKPPTCASWPEAAELSGEQRAALARRAAGAALTVWALQLSVWGHAAVRQRHKAVGAGIAQAAKPPLAVLPDDAAGWRGQASRGGLGRAERLLRQLRGAAANAPLVCIQISNEWPSAAKLGNSMLMLTGECPSWPNPNQPPQPSPTTPPQLTWAGPAGGTRTAFPRGRP